MLAHELRNPLTPITHAVHLLQRESFGGSPAVLYAMIGRQSQRLVRLVDDLLDLARINRGHIELRNSLVNLTTVVQDAAESVRVRMEERRHEIKISVPFSPVCVDGDAARLEQIVSNLLDNAAKYTNLGGRIEVNLTEQAGQAVLSVRDNGIGLATDDLEHIFELFDQVDRSLSRSGGGLGIGLTLVRQCSSCIAALSKREARAWVTARSSSSVCRYRSEKSRKHRTLAVARTPHCRRSAETCSSSTTTSTLSRRCKCWRSTGVMTFQSRTAVRRRLQPSKLFIPRSR